MEIEEEFISGFCRTMNGGETVYTSGGQQQEADLYGLRA